MRDDHNRFDWCWFVGDESRFRSSAAGNYVEAPPTIPTLAAIGSDAKRSSQQNRLS
jgi:hypothetical protein